MKNMFKNNKKIILQSLYFFIFIFIITSIFTKIAGYGRSSYLSTAYPLSWEEVINHIPTNLAKTAILSFFFGFLLWSINKKEKKDEKEEKGKKKKS
jgi:hypothetical protein